MKVTSKLLEKYFLDNCSPDEAYAVEQWLSSADKQEEDLAGMNVLFDRIDKRNDALADEAFAKCAERLNLQSRTAGRRRKFSTWLNVSLVFAVFAAALFIGYWVRPVAEEPSAVEFREVFARRGSSEKVVLPDGSVVILKSGSSLIYPSEFRGGTREVYLSGECYASIAKNPECPFIMSTGVMNVRVTGTEFNIKAFPEDSEAEVALVEGSVQLEGRSGSQTPLQTISLTPGNVVKVDRKNGETRISEFNATNYSEEAAKEEAFVFLDRRFCDIVSELGRRLDVNIIITDATLADRRFYSSFVNGETLDDMLSTFNADRSMNISRENGTIKISRNRI